MKIDKTYRPELIASNDVTRMHISAPHLDVEKKRLVATDGYALVICPVEPETGDTTGYLPSDVLVAARRESKSRDATYLSCNGEIKLSDLSTHIRPNLGEFPDVDQVMPNLKPGDEGTVTFGINPFLLAELAKAMGCARGKGTQIVALTVKLPENPEDAVVDAILVKRGPFDPTGAIMPALV